MRLTIVICGLILVLFNKSYGQSAEKISIPVLKENQRVDKLLDIILGAKKTKKSANNLKDRDSCYVIELFKGNDGSYAYQIKKVTKIVINTLINQRLNRLDLGYFQYRYYHFFTWTNSDFSDLITKTSKVQTLDFVYKLQSIPSLKEPYDIAIWHYLYENGHFVIEDGPPPMN